MKRNTENTTSGKKNNRIIMIIVLVVAVIILGCLGIYKYETGPVDKGNDRQIVVDIEPGSSTSAIAAELKEAGAIKSGFFFRVKSRIGGYDGTYKAGQYGVSRAMSMEEQMKIIKNGDTLGSLFTLVEGMNSKKTGESLEAQGFIKAVDFYREAESGKFDYEFLKDAPEGPGRLEGFLCPETYKIEQDATAHDIIDQMLAQFDKVYNEKYRDKIKGRDINEIMTVASIVEREARTDGDKENVASVIYNRLEAGMPLQMDSILAYITGEDKIKASLEDTEVESSYNPYKNKGLPPGPICSPGEKAIEAAMNPKDTDYLYFVATEKLDGTNVFSETYEEFLKDKAKFNKAYNEYIKKHPDKK